MKRSIFQKSCLIMAAPAVLAASTGAKVALEQFKNLKPLDSKAFRLLDAKKIGDHYMVTADMSFRGQHRTIDLFVTGDRKMVIFGNGFDAVTGKELKSKKRIAYEKQKREEYRKRLESAASAYNPAPLEKLAPFKIGKGKRHYYLFTDFDCPFCQRVEKKLGKLKKDVSLYILPYPLERLHPKSKRKALAFMEMNNKRKKDLIAKHRLSSIDTKGFSPKEETEKKLLAIKEEGDKAHLTGTPFLVNSKGKHVSNIDEIFEQ